MSLETQEIMVAFAIDNKDNVASWGKYALEELQDAYADMEESDRTSTTGKRIKHRIEELENPEEEKVKDEVKDNGQNENPEQQSHDNKPEKQIIIGGIVVVIIVLLLGIYFFV